MKKDLNQPISVASVITSIILLILGILILNLGCKYAGAVLSELDKNCKTCSYFDKDCPYTDDELIAQEYNYSNPYCSDMGIYEMKFKVFGGGLFAIGLGFIIISLINFYKIINPN